MKHEYVNPVMNFLSQNTPWGYTVEIILGVLIASFVASYVWPNRNI